MLVLNFINAINTDTCRVFLDNFKSCLNSLYVYSFEFPLFPFNDSANSLDQFLSVESTDFILRLIFEFISSFQKTFSLSQSNCLSISLNVFFNDSVGVETSLISIARLKALFTSLVEHLVIQKTCSAKLYCLVHCKILLLNNSIPH